MKRKDIFRQQRRGVDLFKRCMLATILLAASMGCHAQSFGVEIYFSEKEMPDMLQFLPAPPDTTSTGFANDIMQYMWGKTQRLDPERADIAIRDAVYGLETIINEFSEPFGLQISETETPEIYRLLQNALLTCECISTSPKQYYRRMRPYVRFKEPTLIPEQENRLKNDGSYPSAHAVLGWSAALLLMEINPEIQGRLELKPKGWQGKLLSGYIFLAVDSIELRRKFVEQHMDSPYIKAVFDFRTLLESAQHYAADWTNSKMKKDLLASMQFSHEEAKDETPVSACGVTLGVATTVRLVCALGVDNYINFVKGKGLKKLVMVDGFNFLLDAF